MVEDYSCRDTPGGIILKDSTAPFGFGGFPKSNFSVKSVKLHNITGYWAGKASPGTAFAIQGVRGFTLSDVVGTMVPQAANIQWADNVDMHNLSITGGHGYNCGHNISNVTLDGAAICHSDMLLF